MKAIGVFPQRRHVGVIDHPEPNLASPTQARFQILDVGVCGTDREIASFQYGTPPNGSQYLIIGHEAVAEVVEVGPEVTNLRVGDLAVMTVRRPCAHAHCVACRSGRQDFCYTGDFTERGIKGLHGFLAEFVVDEARYACAVPHNLREVAVLIEPLTIAEKAVSQLAQIQQRLPWAAPMDSGKPAAHCHRALVLGAGPVGLLGAMKLVLEGFDTYVYSRLRSSEKKRDVVTAIGATFVDELGKLGEFDVVFEACGATSLAFDVLRCLGRNAVFIFTGVPGRKCSETIETISQETGSQETGSQETGSQETGGMMRDQVLKNQVVFGALNAGHQNFADAIRDLGTFLHQWPDALRTVISNRFPIDYALEPLTGKAAGVKNVIAVSK